MYSYLIATEIEKSQPLNIPDAAKRRKKKRTRATDSFTGSFDGSKRKRKELAKYCILIHILHEKYLLQFYRLHTFFFPDLYKLTDEVLGQGAYAKVQGCISLQNGKEFAVKVN